MNDSSFQQLAYLGLKHAPDAARHTTWQCRAWSLGRSLYLGVFFLNLHLEVPFSYVYMFILNGFLAFVFYNPRKAKNVGHHTDMFPLISLLPQLLREQTQEDLLKNRPSCNGLDAWRARWARAAYVDT